MQDKIDAHNLTPLDKQVQSIGYWEDGAKNPHYILRAHVGEGRYVRLGSVPINKRMSDEVFFAMLSNVGVTRNALVALKKQLPHEKENLEQAILHLSLYYLPEPVRNTYELQGLDLLPD